MKLLRPAKATVLIALLLLGCAPHRPFTLSRTDEQRFGSHVLRIPRSGHGDPLIFGVSDCTVFKALTAHDDIVGWKIVLRSDWGASYPKFMTVCTGQDIRYDGRHVRVFLCAQAIGAGGGCADGGNYRSIDGEHRWERSVGSGAPWHLLPP